METPELDEWTVEVLFDGKGTTLPVPTGNFVPELTGRTDVVIVGVVIALMEVADEVEIKVALLEITPVPAGVVCVFTAVLLLGVALGTQLGRVKVSELPDPPYTIQFLEQAAIPDVAELAQHGEKLSP